MIDALYLGAHDVVFRVQSSHVELIDVISSPLHVSRKVHGAELQHARLSGVEVDQPPFPEMDATLPMTTSPVSGTYLDLSARTDTSLFTRSTTPAVVATSVSSSSTPVARARVPCPRRKPSLASTPGMSSPGLTKATARAAFGTGACSSAFSRA